MSHAARQPVRVASRITPPTGDKTNKTVQSKIDMQCTALRKKQLYYAANRRSGSVC